MYLVNSCLVSVSHAVLGILVRGPAHGYDLKWEHDGRFPGSRPMAFGQVYSTLARLVRDGYVEVAEVVHGGGPEKTVYAITDSGRRYLAEWLEQTEPAGPYAADGLVRKTITALHVGADAGGYLRRQRAAHLGRMRELVAARAEQREPAAQIALDHAIEHLDADLRWLETAAARIADAGKVDE